MARVVPLFGRYRGVAPDGELELRVDVDGPRPLARVSGDLFEVRTGESRCVGSFEFDGAAIASTEAELTAEGTAILRGAECAVRVQVARVSEPAGPAAATVTIAPASGETATSYPCEFVSRHFRSVVLEQDRVAGTAPFDSYDTASLAAPPESPPRVLSVAAAFAEAGIEVLASDQNEIMQANAPEMGADLTWSDSELHDAMERHFSLWARAPRWQVWLLVATTHEQGHRGVMFDGKGNFQRQGAAVFFDAIRGDDPASRRAQLRTYVHELGHAFNVLHSWQKDRSHPPQKLGANGGLGELSWMNYPENYLLDPPGVFGDEAYWARFGFQFTDSELAHLRHGAYEHVAMGAADFTTGAADAAAAAELFEEVASGESALTLELRPKAAYAYGEPVNVELKLATDGRATQATHGFLQPRDDFVTIAIRQPSGRVLTYRSLMPRCADASTKVTLDAGYPAHYDSAFLGYGRDGQYFAEPGEYELRGLYVVGDGSRVLSPVSRLQVRAPGSSDDERVGELLLGSEQGQLLYLQGSDADSLRSGNTAIDQLIAEYPEHPLTVHARLLKGVNAGRDFKWLAQDNTLWTRPARTQESVELLTQVVDASRASPAQRATAAGVDDITLSFAGQRLAAAHARAGDVERADAALEDLVAIIEGRGVRPDVLNTVRARADRTRAAFPTAQ